MPHETQVLPTHTVALFDAAVGCAASLLRAGEVVALPTETVYGLAANALDAAAVARIYEAKGRPAHNPIIVHVSDVSMARRCARDWPEAADRLARAFWPGPLTLVLPKSDAVPGIVTAGGLTVGVRCPGHPFIQAVIRACGFPLAAPSANLSEQLSPTSAGHVLKSLRHRVPLIIDGGPCRVGIESTVLDLTRQPPRVLRPGMIHEESLLAALGEPASGGTRTLEGGPRTLRSPGLLPKHYSPHAKLAMLTWTDAADLAELVANRFPDLRPIHVIAHSRVPWGGAFERVAVIPHDAEAFARAIYAELHRCDDEGAALIVVEALPEAPEWHALADRLRRAAA